MQHSLIQQLHIDPQTTKSVTIFGHENSGRTSLVLKIALALQEVTTDRPPNTFYFSNDLLTASGLTLLASLSGEYHNVTHATEVIDTLRSAIEVGNIPTVVCLDNFETLQKGYSPFLLEMLVDEFPESHSAVFITALKTIFPGSDSIERDFDNRSLYIHPDHVDILTGRIVTDAGERFITTSKHLIPLEGSTDYKVANYKTVPLD